MFGGASAWGECDFEGGEQLGYLFSVVFFFEKFYTTFAQVREERLVGRIRNFGHGIPPYDRVMGGDLNIRNKGETGKE